MKTNMLSTNTEKPIPRVEIRSEDTEKPVPRVETKSEEKSQNQKIRKNKIKEEDLLSQGSW